jgi:hypothetical protein
MAGEVDELGHHLSSERYRKQKLDESYRCLSAPSCAHDAAMIVKTIRISPGWKHLRDHDG